MGKSIIFVIVLLSFACAAFAQQPDTVKRKSSIDSLNRKKDSLTSKPFVPKAPAKMKVYHPDSTHSPGKAFRRSGMVPGWGQVYNHRWWKVPLIYGGLGALGYSYFDNQSSYRDFLALSRIRRDPTTRPKPGDKNYDLYVKYSSYSDQVVYDATSGFQRNVQVVILSFIGVWGIQMIDAYIDAKFIHSFTMDNDLSLKISPGIMQQPVYAFNNMPNFTPVLKFTFTLK